MGKLLKSIVLSGAFMASSAFAAAPTWPPFNVAVGADAAAKIKPYAPVPAAAKKWKLCVVLPHMKDSYWVAANYGLVQEAERLGVAMNIYQAGGYDQLPRQVSQFDDCIASKPDAILLAPISEAGFTAKIKDATRKGIAVIGLINPINPALVTATVTNNQTGMGHAAGAFLKNATAAKGGKVVAFPGPQGSGWAENYLVGFKKGLEGSKVNFLAEKFGETGVSVQLRLVEDALQSYPDLTAIWGTGPTVEAAVGAVAEAGMSQVTIISSYADQASLALLKKGKIAGFVTDSPVMMARIAVDQAVTILEKKSYERVLVAPPRFISAQALASTDLTTMFAPANWKPRFSVD